jgi:RNA polymerase sigma-70 factor (ECF subfamily)
VHGVRGGRDGLSEAPASRGELERALREHHAAAHGWALSCCRFDLDRAADVLQEAYLRILDGRARFGGASSFRTWLFGVIRNVARGARRRALLHAALTLRFLAPEAVQRDGGGDEGALRTALLSLSARQREVLVLVFYNDLTIQEAAQALGISLGSARRHYERGKAALRRRLQANDEDRT